MGYQYVDGDALDRLAAAAETIAEGSQGNPLVLDETFEAMLDGTNTTKIFHHWWPLAWSHDQRVGENRYNTLERWFKMLQAAWAGKKYTIRFSDYRVSSSPVGTPMDDLADKTAAICATEVTADDFDWADEDPMTWYIRANALSLQNGKMNILAVEGVDDEFDISGNTAPVYTFRLGLFKSHWTDGTYEYKSFVTEPEAGYVPWAADVNPSTNGHRVMDWQATFGGSMTSDSKLTSGSGFHGHTWERNTNTPAWRQSANAGIVFARKWDAYEGLYSDTDLEVVLDLFQLRHFNLENSGIIEGCLSYNLQYAVAAAETGVTSVLLTAAQAANLVIGGCVEVGSHPDGTNTDRNTAANYDLIAFANILRKEDVTIDGTALVRVHLDIPAEVDIPATAYVSTMPWTPGSTEHLPGHKDGSLYNLTNGKTPARIAGVEIIDGAYAVGLDPLWMSDYNADRDVQSIYTIHQVRDSEYQSGSIGAHHEVSGTFSGATTGWQYEKHLETRTDGMIAPDAVGGSSTTYLKSAFCFGASSGVRAPWRFLHLDGGGYGGLAGAGGYNAPGGAAWNGRPRLSGSGKKRGEWTA